MYRRLLIVSENLFSVTELKLLMSMILVERSLLVVTKLVISGTFIAAGADPKLLLVGGANPWGGGAYPRSATELGRLESAHKQTLGMPFHFYDKWAYLRLQSLVGIRLHRMR